MSALDDKRLQLIQHVWGTDTIPTSRLPTITHAVSNPITGGLTDLDHVDKLDRVLTVSTDLGDTELSFEAWHFVPAESNGKCAFVCDGHTLDLNAGLIPEMIQALLSAHWHVFGYLMPASQTHPWIFAHVLGKARAFEPMFEMPICCLNYALSLGLSTPVAIGLSGGGGTTSSWSALDTRVARSFCINGSMPLYMRAGNAVGDIEQYQPHFHTHAGWLDLYILAAQGRDAYLGFDSGDTFFGEAQYNAETCPARLQPEGPPGLSWQEAIEDAVAETNAAAALTGGSVQALIGSNTGHAISEWMRGQIMTRLP